MRKLIALVCVLALVMAMSVSAFAIVSSSADTDSATEVDTDTSSDSSSKSSSKKSDSTGSNAVITNPANLVDAAIAQKAAEALQALLNGELAGTGYKALTGWLKPDRAVIQEAFKEVKGVDVKLVLYDAEGAKTAEVVDVANPAFDLGGVQAVCYIGK